MGFVDALPEAYEITPGPLPVTDTCVKFAGSVPLLSRADVT